MSPDHSTHADRAGVAILVPSSLNSGPESLSVQRCLDIHRLLVRSRVVEERMMKMSKSGEGYFWIGGPGEEAFNVCLGLLVKKGCGPAFDYLHLHYRNCATMIAMGMPLLEPIRQMAMTLTDTHSMGRNFIGHFARKSWNVVPVTSVIEVQYAMAPGTALVQKRYGGDGITIVTGGDAGSSEGDFASCMIWSSRPGKELPVLMIVTNNGYGISTPASSQHGESHIFERGAAFGIHGALVDGTDPIASWHAIRKGMEYCRYERRPFLLEARVGRLYGHSSSSGALRNKEEEDPIETFEHKLLDAGVIDLAAIDQIHSDAILEVESAIDQVAREPRPSAAHRFRHTYAASTVDVVYPEDYTGLPALK